MDIEVGKIMGLGKDRMGVVGPTWGRHSSLVGVGGGAQ